MELLDDLTAADVSRWLLAVFFTFVAVFYTIRILALSRRTGHSPVHPGRSGSRHCVHHTIFRIFRAAILIVCVARAFWPQIDLLLVPLILFWQPTVLVTGNVLLLLGFVAILYTHFYMDQSWRSGIDEDDNVPLITRGPFAISRNPLFVLIQICQVGLFLSLPSVFTLLCLAVGVFVIQGQVRLEEKHLRRRYGDAYVAYCRSVPRWFRLRFSRTGSSL